MMAIKDVAVSSGSACTSARASSRATCCARSASATSWRTRSIRFGLGRFNTEEEVDYVADLVVQKVKQLREHVAALRDAQGRHRPQVDPVGGALSARDAQFEGTDAMAYSDKVIDHYENPRNVGTLDKDDPNVGTGLVGAPACGDVMRLQIKVERRRRHRGREVQDLRLRLGDRVVARSPPSGSRARRVDEADARSRTPRSSKELNLPPVKIHCSVLAEDAIKSAIADYQKKQAAASKAAE